jgi:hypothetical protein
MSETFCKHIMFSLSNYFLLVGFNDILGLCVSFVRESHRDTRTLMMITSVDRNSEGFEAGSRTVEDDWKD